MTDAAPPSERAFRDAMALYPTGVAIACVDDGDRAHGLTVASFVSVSLEPPLCLVCVKRGSEFLEILRRAERFAVHVLAAEQEAMARLFAGPDRAARLERMSRRPDGPPRVEGAVVVFDLTLEAAHDAGDHAIVIGRLRAIARRDDADGARPLTWWRGRMNALGPS